MKYIITEEQYRRFIKGNPDIQGSIIKYLNRYISNGSRKILKKSRNYGNLREEWCIDEKQTITASYFFEKNKFDSGEISVSEDLVEKIMSIFSVKKSYSLHVIEEWYDEIMVPKFEEIMGESGLYIDSISLTKTTYCLPEPTKPEGITDDEMINYIVKNTLYNKEEVIEKIESGEEDLEDFYLQIVDIINNKKRIGL
jgi:hypothetical protein